MKDTPRDQLRQSLATEHELEFLERWYAAVAIDCRLHDLELEVEASRVDEDDPGYWRAYSSWKRRLTQLVGWHAIKPELRTSEFYDGCHWYLLRVFEGASRG